MLWKTSKTSFKSLQVEPLNQQVLNLHKAQALHLFDMQRFIVKFPELHFHAQRFTITWERQNLTTVWKPIKSAWDF